MHKEFPINIHNSECVDWLHKSYDVTSAFAWLIYVNSKYKKNGKFWMLKLDVELGISMWAIGFLHTHIEKDRTELSRAYMWFGVFFQECQRAMS